MTRFLLIIVTAVALIGCGRSTPSKFREYTGPAVTQILVDKSDRKMWLISGKKVLKVYDVDLGFSPDGHKLQEGDGRTPEGVYYIDRRNPNSAYHLSLGISYPNTHDQLRSALAGVPTGGNIFIHGGPRRASNKDKADWTAGCISVTDKEMEEIYSMVQEGTVIYIKS